MVTAVNDLKVLLSEDEIQTRIKELGVEINNFYKGEEIVVISVLNGAVMFTVDLIKTFEMPMQIQFIRLSSYGNAKTSSGFVKAVDTKITDISGKNVLIVEDIVDTGLTAQYLIKFIEERNPKSVKFCSLLNKKIARKVPVEPDYYGFVTDDKYVVGYGLDEEGYNRNLRYIGYKPL